MISLDSITLNGDSSEIEVVVSASSLTSILFWTQDTYKSSSKVVDLSELIPVDISGNYIFNITLDDVCLPDFNGLFFIEFSNEEDKELALVSNFTYLHECLLNKVLEADIQGCKQKKSSCEECEEDMFYIHILIQSLYTAINLKYFPESIRILKILDELCTTCSSCPKEENFTYTYGYGYGTVNNEIIIV